MLANSSLILKRRCSAFVVALSLYAAAANAQPIAKLPVLNPQAIRAHAEFLSSDLLEGRATGSRGYELAAAYVAAQFRQYGLTPPPGKKGEKNDNGYLQSVPLIEATVVLPGSAASLRRDGSTINFEFSKDYLPSADFFNANSTLSAPLAFVGYGIDAPELKYNDFADVDLQGRIAIILSGAPERFAAAARNYYAWRDAKYARLVKQGAVGVIEIDANDRKEARDLSGRDSPSHWERTVAMSWVSDMRQVNDDEQADERFPELKLKFRFSTDAAPQLFTNNNGHSFEQVLQTAKAGEPQGFALPGMMNLSATTGLRRIDSNNVLGIVRGADPQLQNEYVLVTANLDHLGRGAAVNGDTIYNGLQRNAVGVAMMLEMARGIAALPRPRRSIVFAAVTAGEKGAQGLQHLLTAGPIATRNIVACVALDMPLPMLRTSDVQVTGVDQSSLGPLLIKASTQQNLRIVHTEQQPFSLLNNTLAPLARADIPTLSLHGGLRPRFGDTDLRDLQRDWLRIHINQPSDDMHNAPLDAVAAKELASLNAATVIQLADAAARPIWYRSSLIHQKSLGDL